MGSCDQDFTAPEDSPDLVMWGLMPKAPLPTKPPPRHMLKEVNGLPEGWVLAVDATSQCTYFYHARTGKSQWEWPGDESSMPSAAGIDDLHDWLNSDLAQQLMRARVKKKKMHLVQDHYAQPASPLVHPETGGTAELRIFNGIYEEPPGDQASEIGMPL